MINTSYKIKVTPEQSKIIQKICFKNNIAWMDGSRSVQYINEKPFRVYMFISPTNGITSTNSDNIYYKSINQRISADEFIKKYSDTENYPVEAGKNIKSFELIRCDYESEFYEEINSISEKYQGRIEVDYKPIIGESNRIIYTALVTILPDVDKYTFNYKKYRSNQWVDDITEI